MLHRIVTVAEIVAGLAVLVFVVMLFANEPGGTSGAQGPGARLFSDNCASCHGADGSGGAGPQLSGGAVVRRFPNPSDQIAFVTNGQGAMPAFGGMLSPAEIRQVVAYTRTGLK